MFQKRKLSNQNIEPKYEILPQLEKGDLAKKYNILSNTISGWKKKTDKIKTTYEFGQFGPNRKKKFDDVEEATLKWFNGLKMSVPKISQKMALVSSNRLRNLQKTWDTKHGKHHMADAIMYAHAAWNSASPKTIQNGWFHCIFLKISDEEFHQQCLIAQEIKKPQSEIGLEAMADEIADSIGIAWDEFSNYVHVDDDANAYGELTDEEIIQLVTTKQIQSCKQDDDDQPITIPSYSEMAESKKK
ncbi:hypothetical protein CHS0354_016843 [Potamilus streckersoni]|uniref:DDE-1 domain-containing protein n=1 Tax=Potamilus streckersoni TaxID=2493646 RepID=A0AAE0SWB6_9BIVA|nr:hypothetical protein CHS0354_016843 [Potamilus streckersoni]